MVNQWIGYLTTASVVFGLISAASWFRGSAVKVTQKKAMDLRARHAAARNEKPNFASVSLDDWDMSATFKAQSQWNAAGAFFAACSILAQAVGQAIA